MKRLRSGLDKRRKKHLLRTARLREGPQQPESVVDGQPVLGFCSNDYLGLANHPKVIESFKRAAETYGVGAGSAHLVNGHTAVHGALEEELAAFTKMERAVLFSTGYMANLGIVASLAGRNDRILTDRLNHASLVDAGRLSGARVVRYRHVDLDHIRRRLEDSEGFPFRLIATDGVFSMGGNVAPLAGVHDIAGQHRMWTVVDDAHGFGVLGPGGRGTLEHCRLLGEPRVVLMGTFGKALGTAGAFVAGQEALVETLIQVARTYIFTTAAPPAIAEATRTSLRLLESEAWRRDILKQRVNQFRNGLQEIGLPLPSSTSPIQPLLIGDSSLAMEVSHYLWRHGVWITPIRPPTVPPNEARLRITLTASHSAHHVNRLLDALNRVRRVYPQLTEGPKSGHS